METNELIIVVLGIIGVSSLAVFAYYAKKMSELGLMVEPIAKILIERADVALASYGSALSPIHEVSEAIGTLFDQENDALVRILPANVVAALNVFLGYAQTLTDGVPPQEAIPPVETFK